MDRHSDVVQNENGRAVPGASIQILDQNGSLATIYADRQGAALANPLTTDGLGRWSFCAADGVYSAKVYLAGVLKATLPDIRLEDPSDGLAALSAPTGATLIGTSAGTVQGEITTLKSVVAGLYNYTLTPATSSALGGVKAGSGVNIAGDGTLSVTPYSLPAASAATLGGVKAGTGLTVDGAGVLSLTYSYTLPPASASVLGGIKVGAGLAMDANSVLSATGLTTGSVASVNSVTPTSGNVVLTTDNLPESGTPTNQWLTAARVRSVVLTGLTTATNAAAAATDTLLAAIGKLQAQISANSSAITTNTTAIATKDATGGYAGLTGFAINLKNAAGTIVSSIASIATAARTYTFPDKSGTVAMLSDVSNGSMVFLGTATVSTAVASIDFLTVFSAAYDKYIIEIEGVNPSAADTLALYLAKAGAVDTLGNYTAPAPPATGTQTASQGSVYLSSNGTKYTYTLHIRNANDTVNPKGIRVDGTYLNAASGNYTSMSHEASYVGANTVTGFRLFWLSASNFVSGTVRVYGIKIS